MKWILLSLVGIIVLGGVGFAGWILSLPQSVAAAPVAVPAEETASLIEALRPRRERRPVVAVIGLNDATETLDYVMSTGILRRSGVADVVLVAAGEGPVRLYPVLQVQPDMTIAQFDAAHPEGADYVIVPAMSRDDDPAIMAWLKGQARKGSMVIGVCAGAKVVAAAGLLENRRGTTHWFYKNELLKRDPSVTLVADRRFVVDGPVATTTGISAAIPFALTLIEAIGGHDRAETTARSLGIAHWDASHDSDAFGIKREFATTVLGNVAAFWQRDTFAVPLAPGFDAVSVALVADAWSRTYRSKALTLAGTPGPVSDVTGIRIVPDRSGAPDARLQPLEVAPGAPPAEVLDAALTSIGKRYGDATENVVAMQLEYPRHAMAR
jgi:putative intracellular protease/amidase